MHKCQHCESTSFDIRQGKVREFHPENLPCRTEFEFICTTEFDGEEGDIPRIVYTNGARVLKDADMESVWTND